jgi:hypothetical protein
MAAEIARCNVQVGGAGVRLPTAVSSWTTDIIHDGTTEFRQDDPIPTDLDLRFQDPTCQIVIPPRNFCEHFVPEPYAIPQLCSCTPRAVAVLTADLALVGADPPSSPDLACPESTVCVANRNVFLVHRTSGAVEVLGGDPGGVLDTAYAGSGSVALATTFGTTYAIDFSSKAVSTPILFGATRLIRSGTGSAGRVLAYSVNSESVRSFAAGSTRSSPLLELPGAPLTVSAPSPDRLIVLLVNTASVSSMPATFAFYENGIWRQQVEMNIIGDYQSRILSGDPGTLLVASDVPTYRFKHEEASADTQVFFQPKGDTAFQTIQPGGLREGFTGALAVPGGFLISRRGEFANDTVLGFDGKTTCDMLTTFGGTVISRDPLGYDWNPVLGVGAWVGTTETNIPRIVWFTIH